MVDYEFYPTPEPFTRWLIYELRQRGLMASSRSVHDPCAGDLAILRPFQEQSFNVSGADLDPRWGLDVVDAVYASTRADWQVTNPPFSLALQIVEQMGRNAAHGVALYHRCTLREPLKGLGLGRSFFRDHPPTMTLWCPRFAHQRNAKGKWATDSATCVWSVWVPGAPVLGDVWPPDSLFDELKAYTPEYREHVDRLMASRL